MMLNKRGASLSAWSEVAVFVVLLMIMILMVVANFNAMYGYNYDGTFGIGTNATESAMKSYQADVYDKLSSGEATTGGISGVSVSTTWEIILGGLGMIKDVITGGWIERGVALAHLPWQLGLFLRILFILSLVYIAIKLLLKVNP